MAQANQIPQSAAIRSLSWFYETTLVGREADSLREDLGRLVDRSSSQICLLDVLYLWLRAPISRETEDSSLFESCPTYESYLLAVSVIIDAWHRTGGSWGKLSEPFGQISGIFPTLPPYEGVDEFYVYDHENAVYGAQYDHPALRRDTYEHYRALAEQARIDCVIREAVARSVRQG